MVDDFDEQEEIAKERYEEQYSIEVALPSRVVH